MAVTSPICGSINNAIVESYDNVIMADTIEYNGKYIVAIESMPFFARSEKNKFINSVKDTISTRFGVDKDDIKIIFDLDTIYRISQANNEEDIKLIFGKVGLL